MITLNVFVTLVSLCTLFPESLTRKLYRKKIPEMALNVTHVTRENFSGIDMGTLRMEQYPCEFG
jgi:hypothetical protein